MTASKSNAKSSGAKSASPKASASSSKKAAAKAAPAKAAPARGHAVGSATAAAILGFAPNPKGKAPKAGFTANGGVKIKPEWQKYYNTLLGLRERLLAQMNGLAKESAETVTSYSLHMGDAGTDNFDRDFALSLLSSDQDAIYEIEEALRRIEKGVFGVCELTGKQIPKARLEAIPWTRFTVEAQAQLEKEGALRQKRLGSLGSVDSVGGSDVDDDDGDDDKPAKEKE